MSNPGGRLLGLLLNEHGDDYYYICCEAFLVTLILTE